MRVPILAILPSQPALRASARFGLGLPGGRAGFADLRLAEAITLDPRVPAIPVGTDDGCTEAAALHVDRSDRFAVRGFVDVEDPAHMPERVGGVPIHSDPVIAPFLTRDGSAPIGTAAQVAARLDLDALQARGLDGRNVAVAVMDTGINLPHLTRRLGWGPRLDAANSWSPPGSAAAGTHPVDHGTMCAYGIMIAAPKATLLDFPILHGRAASGSTSGRTLATAFQAYAHLAAAWTGAYAPEGLVGYNGLVVSNSWGVFHPSWDFPAGHPGRYIDNPRHIFAQQVATLAASGADIAFAAGHHGGHIEDVLTIDGCDVDGRRPARSTQPPVIAGMPAPRPDLTSYTHFSGSEAFGRGSPDSGTSAACPVAAGCLAALRAKVPPKRTPPARLVAHARATARPTPGSGWSNDHGYGILDLGAMAATLGV
jgi:hypothetical protein